MSSIHRIEKLQYVNAYISCYWSASDRKIHCQKIDTKTPLTDLTGMIGVLYWGIGIIWSKPIWAHPISLSIKTFNPHSFISVAHFGSCAPVVHYCWLNKMVDQPFSAPHFWYRMMNNSLCIDWKFCNKLSTYTRQPGALQNIWTASRQETWWLFAHSLSLVRIKPRIVGHRCALCVNLGLTEIVYYSF